MSSLAVIRLLLEKMTTEEKKVARSFLTAFNTRGNDAPNQALNLFEILVKERAGDVMDDSAIEKIIYGAKGGSAFPRLILRLRDKLFESLLLSVNLEREGAYSERGRALHEIRKGISQAQILQSRGTWNAAPALLDDCIKQSEKFEHFEELIAALRVRMEMRSVDKGTTSLMEENQRFDKALRSLVASKKALEYFHELAAHTEFKAKGLSLSQLKNRIDDLQAEYEATGSANVAFFSNYLEIHLYQELHMHRSASIILKRQADLVEVHPAIYSKTRLAGVIVNLAWNELYTRQFEMALEYSSKAKKLVNEKHFNYFRCLDTDFYAYFYLGRYEDALKTIDILLKSDSSADAGYRTGKREYLKACVLFMMHKHEEAHKILTSLNPIENDAEGWNLALRMLFIMNDIEMEKTDNAFNRIENLRKHMDKLRKGNKENTRESLKFELLRAVANSGFDYSEARKKRSDELERLSNSGDARWEILSPELIIFDQWFGNKLTRREFTMNIPAYTSPVNSAGEVTDEMAVEINFPKPKSIAVKKAR